MHWGIATALIDAGRRPGELGLFEVDEAWLPAVAAGARAATRSCSATSSATSSTATASSSCSPTAGPSWSSERAGSARFVLNADDPLVADLGRERPGVVYFGVSDDSQALPELQHAADSKHCRNCGTPYDYEAVYLGHLGRYRCPGCGRTRPEPDGGRRARRARRDGRARVCRCARRPARPTSASPSPASTTSTTRSPPRRPRSSWARRSSDVKASLEAQAAAFGRVETIPVDGRDVSILLVKNPAGANEVLRTLTLEEARARPLDRAERQDRRRPRRLVGLGRGLRAARRPRAPRDLLGHARGGDGAAAEVRRDRRGRSTSSATSGARSTRRSPACERRRPAVRAARPTPRCSSCATCSPTAGWRGHGRA